MADEPLSTSISYSPYDAYTAPLGRLPILGKARAEIDTIRLNAAKLAAEIRKTEADVLKTDSEIKLLDQKTASELAQTDNVIPIGVGLGTLPRTVFTKGATNDLDTVTGVVGSQRQLFRKQTDGFDRDAEQKLSKIMVDTWSVRQTTVGGQAVNTAGMMNSDIWDALKIAKEGVGIAVGTAPPSPLDEDSIP